LIYIWERDGNQKNIREYGNKLSHCISQYNANYNIFEVDKMGLAKLLLNESTLKPVIIETYPELAKDMDLEMV
jgi:hypothetical protein